MIKLLVSTGDDSHNMKTLVSCNGFVFFTLVKIIHLCTKMALHLLVQKPCQYSKVSISLNMFYCICHIGTCQVFVIPNHEHLPENIKWYAGAVYHFLDVWTNDIHLRSTISDITIGTIAQNVQPTPLPPFQCCSNGK